MLSQKCVEKTSNKNHPAKVLVAWLAGFSKSILRKEEESKAKDKATKAQDRTKHYTQLLTDHKRGGDKVC